jgi:hypothetical protein
MRALAANVKKWGEVTRGGERKGRDRREADVKRRLEEKEREYENKSKVQRSIHGDGSATATAG